MRCGIYGCSLITDALSDRKQKDPMNVVKHCLTRTAFLDSSDISKNNMTEAAYSVVNKETEDSQEAKLIQNITENESNNMLMARILALKTQNIFQTY